MSDYVDVFSAAEIAPGTLRRFEIAGRGLLICRAGDGDFATGTGARTPAPC